jgi:hypothetical protein
VLDEFWNDPTMELADALRDWVRDEYVFGELALRCWVNEVSGRLRLTVISTKRIKDVIPSDRTRDAILLLHHPDHPEGVPVPIVTFDDWTDPANPRWTGEAFYFARNRTAAGQHRGTPDMLPIADHVDGFDQVAFNAVERSGLINAFVWDVELTGASDQQIVDWLGKPENRAAPRPGTVRVHNDKEKWQAVAPQMGAYEAAVTARLAKNIALGGAGVPEGWFAEGGETNRSTLQEQGDPTYRLITAIQRHVKSMFRRILTFVLQNAADHGRIDADVLSRVEVVVNLPEPSSEDTGTLGKLLADLVGALQTGVDSELISTESARKVFLQAVALFGIELDPEDESDLIDGESAQREAKRQQELDSFARAGVDAVVGAPGQDPKPKPRTIPGQPSGA